MFFLVIILGITGSSIGLWCRFFFYMVLSSLICIVLGTFLCFCFFVYRRRFSTWLWELGRGVILGFAWCRCM